MSNDDDKSQLNTPLIVTTEIGVDDMLREYTGEFGPWQYRHFAFTSVAWALNAFHTLVVVFADREPPGFVEPGYSTVSEWGLFGNDRFKIGFVQSAFFAGSMIGAGIFGQLSDTYLGRKGTLTLTSSMNAILGILTAFSPSLPIYAALRFLTGLSTGGLGLSAFILATEPVGPTKRGPVAMSTFYFFSLGAIILATTAMFLPHWRHLYIASSIPTLMYVILIVPFISESPRWHLVRGNVTSAMKIMRSIAKCNNKSVPENITLALDNHKQNSSMSTALDVLRSSTTRSRLVLSATINFLLSVAYYGLTFNVKNLSTDVYISVMLNAAAEVPAYMMTAVLVKGCGRRMLIVCTLGLAAVFCVAASMSVGVVRTGFGMMGLFVVTAAFNLVFVYATELFPTTVRNTALGWVSQAGQTGAVVAPMVVVLGRDWPFVIFGGCAVVGGVLGFGLPETLGRPLYETMEGLEKGERADLVEKTGSGFEAGFTSDLNA